VVSECANRQTHLEPPILQMPRHNGSMRQ
jgi:hypothetical protein